MKQQQNFNKLTTKTQKLFDHLFSCVVCPMRMFVRKLMQGWLWIVGDTPGWGWRLFWRSLSHICGNMLGKAAQSRDHRPMFWNVDKFSLEAVILVNFNLPVVRFVYEDDMIVPDDQFLLISARLLSPEWNNSLLVADKHHPALAHLARVVLWHRLNNLVHILLAVTCRVAALKYQSFLSNLQTKNMLTFL